MSRWSHLFVDGEFAARERILSGMTLEQVRTRPGGAPHSIYDELWHADRWQSVVLRRDREAADDVEATGPDFPQEPPATEADWRDLVARFLAGAQLVLAWEKIPGKISAEVRPGVSLGDVLVSLALHNAYHLGKIVALRQMTGAWPPAET